MLLLGENEILLKLCRPPINSEKYIELPIVEKEPNLLSLCKLYLNDKSSRIITNGVKM